MECAFSELPYNFLPEVSEASRNSAQAFAITDPSVYKDLGHPDELIIVVDGEYTGELREENDVIAMGLAVIAIWSGLTYAILDYLLVPLRFDMKKASQWCVRDFWRNPCKVHPSILPRYLVWSLSSPPLKESMAKLFEFIDKYDQLYNNGHTCVRIASDNPAVDITWLEYLGGKHLKRPNLAYRKDVSHPNGYSWVRTAGFNPDDYYKPFLPRTAQYGFGAKLAEKLGVTVPKLPFEYEHLAHLDALHIGIEYAILSLELEKRLAAVA